MIEQLLDRMIEMRAERAGYGPGYLTFVELGRKPSLMERYRRAIRKDREKRAKELHAPKTDEARSNQMQLVIFDAIVKCNAEANAKSLNDQQRARLADFMAAKATKQIEEIWRDG